MLTWRKFIVRTPISFPLPYGWDLVVIEADVLKEALYVVRSAEYAQSPIACMESIYLKSRGWPIVESLEYRDGELESGWEE